MAKHWREFATLIGIVLMAAAAAAMAALWVANL